MYHKKTGCNLVSSYVAPMKSSLPLILMISIFFKKSLFFSTQEKILSIPKFIKKPSPITSKAGK